MLRTQDLSRFRQAFRLPLSVTLVALCGLIALAGIAWDFKRDVHIIKSDFRDRVNAEAHNVTQEVTFRLNAIYQGLRTVARLPGTRNIAESNFRLDETTRRSIQEIYNNLYTNIALSEVYIVPLRFDPDRSAGAGGSFHEPVATFDEFIVGRNAIGDSPGVSRKGAQEIEIYEYRVMQDQLRWFREHVPSEDKISALAYPAITSREVVTCDNRYFFPDTPDDKDRSGIVYSVPFYDDNGQLQGMVSGVLLTRALQELMPSGNYVVLNNRQEYTVTPRQLGPWQQVLSTLRAGMLPDDLSVSSMWDIPIHDVDGNWQLWVGFEDAELRAVPLLRSARESYLLSSSIAILFTIGFCAYVWVRQRQRLSVSGVKGGTLSGELAVDSAAAAANGDEPAPGTSEIAGSADTATAHNASPVVLASVDALLASSQTIKRHALDANYRQLAAVAQDTMAQVHDILDIARIENGTLQLMIHDVDVADLVREVSGIMRPLAASSGNKFVARLAADVGSIKTDVMRLRQILITLITTSSRYTKGGQIMLMVHRATRSDRSVVMFTLRDNGSGMTGEQVAGLLDALETRDDGGRTAAAQGLGLAISRRLAQLLGGEVEVHTELGRGTMFNLTLPLASQATVTADTRSESSAV